jgi:hypothetical protein
MFLSRRLRLGPGDMRPLTEGRITKGYQCLAIMIAGLTQSGANPPRTPPRRGIPPVFHVQLLSFKNSIKHAKVLLLGGVGGGFPLLLDELSMA